MELKLELCFQFESLLASLCIRLCWFDFNQNLGNEGYGGEKGWGTTGTDEIRKSNEVLSAEIEGNGEIPIPFGELEKGLYSQRKVSIRERTLFSMTSSDKKSS